MSKSGQEIIPANENQRAIVPRHTWLPALTRNKAALGVFAGAVGSVALRKLVELAVEELFGRFRNRARRSIRRRRPRPVDEQRAIAEQPSSPQILIQERAVVVGVVRNGGAEESFAAAGVREQVVTLLNNAEDGR